MSELGPLTVRRVSPAELAAVGELTVEAYMADGYGAAYGDYVHELRDAAGRDRDAEVWVAVAGATGEPVGNVTFCPVGSPYRELAVDDTEAEFRMLAVAPSVRRRGIARLLTQHCLDRARELGQRRMVMCSDWRMAAAHSLYTGMGFRRLPERDWSPKPGVDLLAFAIDL